MAFGVIDLQGNKKPEYHALQQALRAQSPETPQFVLGFKEIADRHPILVGEPVDPIEWGPWKNSSFQRTTQGLLIWGLYVESGDQKGFISNSGLRYRWETDHLERIDA